mmetsp:Transcript_45720/g.106116  ORF Transcript_45720/g.106116 Transcript_45720/m.106116 type:complete len:201 (+) Transcript_45720:40-642(+)
MELRAPNALPSRPFSLLSTCCSASSFGVCKRTAALTSFSFLTSSTASAANSSWMYTSSCCSLATSASTPGAFLTLRSRACRKDSFSWSSDASLMSTTVPSPDLLPCCGAANATRSHECSGRGACCAAVMDSLSLRLSHDCDAGPASAWPRKPLSAPKVLLSMDLSLSKIGPRRCILASTSSGLSRKYCKNAAPGAALPSA